MNRQDNQGRTLPSSRPDAKVSAVGKRVARLRHTVRDHWASIELALGVLMFVGTGALMLWGLMVLLIGVAPLNR